MYIIPSGNSSAAIMALSSNIVIQELSQQYMDSREYESIKNEWSAIVRGVMSKRLELIRDGIKDFSRAHEWLLREIAQRRERDDTAEQIIREISDDLLPGGLDLISQIDQLVNQQPGHMVEEAVMTCDDDDGRSFTMDVEPGPSTRRRGNASMGPPPRPAAPLTPVTPTGSKGTRNQTAHEEPSGAATEHPFSDTAHGSLVLQQTAKRSLDVVEIDQPRTPESPSKKAKSSTAPQSVCPVTKSVHFWEVEGQQFIFKNEQWGPGCFIVRCGLGQRVPFLKHPLKGNAVMDHFNDDDQPCHDSRRIYTFDDILSEYTFRGEKATHPSRHDDPLALPN